MIGLFFGLVFIILGGIMFVGGIAVMFTGIWGKVFGPPHDPYDYSLPQNRYWERTPDE